MKSPALPLVLLLSAVLGLLVSPAQAQLVVGLTTQKKELVAYEPVRSTVSITNRSANPILLASSTENGQSWIRFMASNERGDNLPLTGELKNLPPIQLRPGETIQRSVDLATIFPMSNFGAYTIQAHVYCAPDRAYAPSNRVRVNIVGARELWSTAFGVPHGSEGGGTSRIFRLLQYRSMDDVQLYVRLEDRATAMVLACFSIGKLLEMNPPLYGLDPNGRLHVLYLHTPTISYHVIVDSSGKVVGSQAYQEYAKSRPTLRRSVDGSYSVEGGRLYDPAVIAAQKLSTRKASERPAGLNELLGKPAPGSPARPQTAPAAPAPAAASPQFAPLQPLDTADPNYQPLAPTKKR